MSAEALSALERIEFAARFVVIVDLEDSPVGPIRLSRSPRPVVDASQAQGRPVIVGVFCEKLGLEFDDAMLSWESGLRETDGCWAEAWYGNALASTGFAPYREKKVRVPPAFRELEDRCVELYDRLHAHRLLP